jgi:apolipoprotein D and lipocalin family protein
MRSHLCLILAFIPLLTACQNRTMPEINYSTVPSVEIDRYLGKWYEIARFPHRFEKGLIGVTATYTKRDDGKIAVLNAGYMNSFEGKYKEARGVAKIPDKDDPSKLKVSFFLFFYADYYILELDTVKYQYALVGSSSENYLWILGRNPLITDEIYNMLVEKAKARGYLVEKLIKVRQKPLIEYEKDKTL